MNGTYVAFVDTENGNDLILLDHFYNVPTKDTVININGKKYKITKIMWDFTHTNNITDLTVFIYLKSI